MIQLKGKSDVGEKINTQIIQPLIDANSRLARSDFPDFDDPNKLGEGSAKVQCLTNLIGIFQKPELNFSKNRAENDDIIHDFGVLPRLNNDRGTAILVAASIYDACHYFRAFHSTNFGQYCGIITSYEPNPTKISREPANSDERYKFDTYDRYILKHNQTAKQYEETTKTCFLKEPANCKLLIVVSKLLTGFDAPSCTYIYSNSQGC